MDSKRSAKASFLIEENKDSVFYIWTKLYDKARYLKSEHDLKEKEYGIPWRTAYKTAVISAVNELEKAKICNERVSSSEQAFEIIHLAAKNIKGEVDRANNKKQEDHLKLIRERYQLFEKFINFLKKLLKEPDSSKFEAIKKETFA